MGYLLNDGKTLKLSSDQFDHHTLLSVLSDHIKVYNPQENLMIQYTDDNLKFAILFAKQHSEIGKQLSFHHQYHQQTGQAHVNYSNALLENITSACLQSM